MDDAMEAIDRLRAEHLARLERKFSEHDCWLIAQNTDDSLPLYVIVKHAKIRKGKFDGNSSGSQLVYYDILSAKTCRMPAGDYPRTVVQPLIELKSNGDIMRATYLIAAHKCLSDTLTLSSRKIAEAEDVEWAREEFAHYAEAMGLK